MCREVLGDSGDLVAHLLERAEIDAGLPPPGAFFRKADVGPSAIEPVGAIRPVGLARREFFLKIAAELRL